MWMRIEVWPSAWRNRIFRDQFLSTIIVLTASVTILRVYLEHIERRTGIAFTDPLPPLAPAIDLNWVIFAVLYSGLLFGLVSLFMYPFRLLLTMRALVVLAILRIVCLFVMPLDSTPGGIPLLDPIVDFPALRFTGVHGLFFCWEVAVLALLSMTSRWRDLRMIFAAAAVVMSVLLFLQQAQYAVSLLAAPAFAYAAYGLARYTTAGDVREIREVSAGTQMPIAVGRN